MDNVIGKKSGGAGILAIMGFVLCLACSIITFGIYFSDIASGIELFWGIVFGLMAIGSFIYSIYFFTIPKNLIIDTGESVSLPLQNAIIAYTKIRSVISRCQRAKYLTYSFGSIIIELEDGSEIIQEKVSDVETVASYLIRKMKEAK